MLLWSIIEVYFGILCAEPHVGSVFPSALSVLDTPRKLVFGYSRAGLRHRLTFCIEFRRVFCNMGLLCYNIWIKWTWSSFLFSNSSCQLQRSLHEALCMYVCVCVCARSSVYVCVCVCVWGGGGGGGGGGGYSGCHELECQNSICVACRVTNWCRDKGCSVTIPAMFEMNWLTEFRTWILTPTFLRAVCALIQSWRCWSMNLGAGFLRIPKQLSAREGYGPHPYFLLEIMITDLLIKRPCETIGHL